MYSIISESPIFKGLKLEEVENILKNTHHQVKKFNPDTIIASNGDKCNNLYIIIEGSVRGEVEDIKAKTIKIEDIYVPDAFAEAFLFATNNNILVNIVTNTETKILIIFKNDLLKLFQSNQIILENYLQIISDRFILVTKKLRFLSLKSIKGKLAQYLLQLSKENNSKSFTLIKTQNELAEYFGVKRPSLARSIRELDEENIIKARGKNIEIIKLDKLSSYIKH